MPPVSKSLGSGACPSERAGLFGVPSFTVGDALFRGDDRLEDALSWA
ncbi:MULTISPECIES: hypothetical protein [unclassified Rhodosalinus]